VTHLHGDRIDTGEVVGCPGKPEGVKKEVATPKRSVAEGNRTCPAGGLETRREGSSGGG